MRILVSLLELFSVFCLLSDSLLMHTLVTEMAIFRSFQIRTLAFGLISEIIGSLYLGLSFLIVHSIFKSWHSKCPILLCKIQCWSQKWLWERLVEDLDSKWKKVERHLIPRFMSYVVLHVFGIAGIMCLGLLAQISYPKFLEDDIGWPRYSV